MAEVNGTQQAQGESELVVRQVESEQQSMSRRVDGCLSNSSLVTSLTREVGSIVDRGPVSRTGSGEGNPGSVVCSSRQVSPHGASCESDSDFLVNDGCAIDWKVSESGSKDELEVLNLSSTRFHTVLFKQHFYLFLHAQVRIYF